MATIAIIRAELASTEKAIGSCDKQSLVATSG